MGVFDMVAVIVIFGLLAELAKTWIKNRNTGSAGLSSEQQARIDRLEQRVKHLEAVVSDPDSQLREKFREIEV